MERVIRYFSFPCFTEAQWSSRNPLLVNGEIGFVLNESNQVIGHKVGPGLWNFLPLLGSDIYPYSDIVTNVIGDASGNLQNQKIVDILKKMLSPYQAPAITNLRNNAASGGGFVNVVTREIGQSLAGPVQITFSLSNQASLSGATPINITSGGTFTNEGDFTFALPISLNLAVPLNPVTTSTTNISAKVTHTNGQTSPIVTSIRFFPKIMWANSPLDTLSGVQFMSISNKGTLVTNTYKNDYPFNGNGYSWLAIPVMLNPTGLIFTDVTNPIAPANYAMESKGVISINNGVATYNYSLYRSTFFTINPSILRIP